MTRYLFDDMWSVGELITRSQTVLLCMEFDGVIVPAVDEDVFVSLSPQMQRVLWSLTNDEKCKLAFASYRSRFELQTRIGLPDVWYLGCHGLELSGPGDVFVHPSGAAYSQQLQPIAAHLQEMLQSFPDMRFEDRGLTLRVPFFSLPASRVEQVTNFVRDLTRRHAPTCRLITNEEFLEIRPNIPWDRVSALQRIQNRLAPLDPLLIYLGSDEAGTFEALEEAITVHVGECDHSPAQYYVSGPPDVRRFFEWVASLTREQQGVCASGVASH
jgi:trehalose-phosphatase